MSNDWKVRAEHWQEDAKVSCRNGAPLILSGHGVSLRINHGALEIKNGFTHYPQEREAWRLFPGDPMAPDRIILLDGSGAMTLDVMGWLSTQNIPLIRLDYRGNSVSILGSGGMGADPHLLQAQVTSAQNAERSSAISAWLIQEKLIASRKTLLIAAPAAAVKAKALERLDADIVRLSKPGCEGKEVLMGIEGKCAQVYFDSLRNIPIAWKGNGRKPIPESWHTIGPRNSRKSFGSRFARHPIQANLNYAYALLESQLRIGAARIGLDPSIGFLHSSREGRSALIFDLMEPLRPTADEAVLRFITKHTFVPDDFTVASDGTCRLHPQLARKLVAEVGQVEGINSLLGGLFKQFGHQIDVARQHRSQAWLAQKALKTNK